MGVSTTEAQRATENSGSLFLYSQLLAVTQIIKTNHTKLDSTRSFCPQPTSWVLGMGLESEAGGVSGQCHWEEMKTAQRGSPSKERNKLSAPPLPLTRVRFFPPRPQGTENAASKVHPCRIWLDGARPGP